MELAGNLEGTREAQAKVKEDEARQEQGEEAALLLHLPSGATELISFPVGVTGWCVAWPALAWWCTTLITHLVRGSGVRQNDCVPEVWHRQGGSQGAWLGWWFSCS